MARIHVMYKGTYCIRRRQQLMKTRETVCLLLFCERYFYKEVSTKGYYSTLTWYLNFVLIDFSKCHIEFCFWCHFFIACYHAMICIVSHGSSCFYYQHLLKKLLIKLLFTKLPLHHNNLLLLISLAHYYLALYTSSSCACSLSTVKMWYW
jgi:hypothetical protein